MGQYSGKFGSIKYNDGNINTSKGLLNNAKSELDGTRDALIAGFKTLGSARGSEWIDYQQNEKVIEDFPSNCCEYIDDLFNSMSNKAKEIEEYRDAPLYKKIFATVGMGLSKFTEGILTVGENIVDAGASLVGFTAGIFGNKDLQNSCAEFVKVNAMADTFNWINDKTGINKYSAMSPESTGAKLFKMGGTVAGYIIAGAATGGALGIGATAANTTVAAVAGLGAGTESGLMQGKDFNAAFGQGVKQAAIQGVTAYAAGKIGEKLQSNALSKAEQQAMDKVDDAQKALDEAQQSWQEAYQKFGEQGSHAQAEAMQRAQTELINAQDDLANLSVNTSTVYDNKVTNKIADKTASKLNDFKVNHPNITSTVSNTGKYVSDVTKATGNLGKAIVSPVTNSAAGKAVGNAVTGMVSKGSGIANNIVTGIASHPIAGQVVATTLATAPEAAFALKNEDIRIKTKNNDMNAEIKDKVTYTSDDIFHRDNPDENSDKTDNDNNTKDVPSFDMEDNSSSGNTGSNSSSGGNYNGGGGNYNGGGSNNTPTVAYRQVNDNTTPTETPTKVTETEKATPEKIDTTPKETTPSTKTNPTTPTPKKETPAPADKPSFNDDNLKQTPQPQSYDPGTIGGGSSSYNNGGYTYSGGESSYGDYSTEDPIDVASVTTEAGDENIMGDSSVGLGNLASSITNTQSYKNQTIKIPTTTGTVDEGSTNVAIPTAAALSAAAAAGIGAKAYVDYKENHKESEDEEESYEDGEENNGFYTEEWNGSEDDMKIDYGNEEEATLDDDDDYKYSANSIIQKYEDGNNLDLEEA